MQSKWSDLHETAISLRKDGQSIKTIHRYLGVPLSTLSGWLRDVILTPEQQAHLQEQQAIGLQSARLKAADWHHAQKALRLHDAKRAAEATLDDLPLTASILDLALAMLYLGGGTKTDNSTVLASSNSDILRFYLYVLNRNYGIKPEQVRCDLHLRLDQDAMKMKQYWSKMLGVPLDRFRHVAFDKRSLGKATYDRYKGVCVVDCGNVAVQRKLVYLYTLFCERIVATRGD